MNTNKRPYEQTYSPFVQDICFGVGSLFMSDVHHKEHFSQGLHISLGLHQTTSLCMYAAREYASHVFCCVFGVLAKAVRSTRDAAIKTDSSLPASQHEERETMWMRETRGVLRKV